MKRILEVVFGALVFCATIAAETNQFRKVVLAKGLNDPMELSVAKDGRVFFVERAGAVKIWKPETKETIEAGKVSVFLNYNAGAEEAAKGEKGGWEDGLLPFDGRLLHLDLRPGRFRPVEVKESAPRLIDPLVGVGTKIIPLGLQEAGGQPLGAVPVVVGERRGKGG